MITLGLAAAIATLPTQEHTFQLGWEVGDKIVYLVNLDSETGISSGSGEITLNVTSLKDGKYHVSWIEVKTENNQRKTKSGTCQFSKHGEYFTTGATGSAEFLLLQMALPASSISVGETYKTQSKVRKDTFYITGKFLKFDDGKSLAHLQSNSGPKSIKADEQGLFDISTVFDLKQQLITEGSLKYSEFGLTYKIKLKELIRA